MEVIVAVNCKSYNFHNHWSLVSAVRHIDFSLYVDTLFIYEKRCIYKEYLKNIIFTYNAKNKKQLIENFQE